MGLIVSISWVIPEGTVAGEYKKTNIKGEAEISFSLNDNVTFVCTVDAIAQGESIPSLSYPLFHSLIGQGEFIFDSRANLSVSFLIFYVIIFINKNILFYFFLIE